MKVHVHQMEEQVLNFAAAKASGLRVGFYKGREGVVPCHWVNTEWDGDEEFSLPEYHHNGQLTAEILNVHGYRVGPQSIQALVDDAPEPGKPHPFAWECSTSSGLSVYGPTVEVAVARCLVADRLGLEVELPDELFQ